MIRFGTAPSGMEPSTGHYAVTTRPQNTAVAAGVIRRQFTAPAVGSERCFVCIVAGTTANVTDATWTLTRGAKTTDGTATWQECTGASAVNGDLANTATWTQAKAIGVPTLGAIIQRNNGASYQICSTAGTMGACEPAWSSNTAGTTQTDGTTTWTCLGVVGNFTGGQALHARLANVFGTNWFAAGNTVYVGSNHAESQTTSITLSPVGSAATVGRIICHNAGSYPPAAGNLTTGAVVSTTAASTNIIIFPPSGGGAGLYIYGLTFRPGVGQSTAGNANISGGSCSIYFDACSFDLASTAAGAVINTNSSGGSGVVVFNNTTVKFGNVSQGISIGLGQFIWQNTASVLAAGSSVPTPFITPSASSYSYVVLEALDLSQITGVLIEATSGTSYTTLLLKDCKLNASATIDTPVGNGITYQIVRSDSAAAAYKSARYAFEGVETTETSITRVGGAVDPTGQAQSRKIVTTVNSKWLRPFKAEPYAQWNSITGANVT